eukprot:jgi/Astpho2/3349/fgenesh1_pg.00054_%23_36_t
MLVAVVHSIPAGHGAKVPFSMMMLLEHVKKGKDLSPDMHCRMVVPTSGTRSISLWDVPDKDTLQTWLDEFLDVDCSNEVFEVQEDFSYGFIEQLNRTRAAEKVSAQAREYGGEMAGASKRTIENVAEVDSKLKVSEHASVAYKRAQESVAPVFSRVNMAAKEQYSKALENERIAAAAGAVDSRWTTIMHVSSKVSAIAAAAGAVGSRWSAMTQGLGKGFGALRQQADQATANLTGRSPRTPGSGSDPGHTSSHSFSGSAGGAPAGAASAPLAQRCAAAT